MKLRSLLAVVALLALAVPLSACASARGPATADENACGVPPDSRLTAEATGELAQAPAAVGPEASTSQGRRSVAPSTGVGVNRGQGDNVTTTTAYDGSATVSAGAPAVVQTLFGAQANAIAQTQGAASDPALDAYREELAGIRTRVLGPITDAERSRLDARADALLDKIATLAAARVAASQAAATAPPPSFPNLTTVVFTNASGSSAGSDKPAVDPANAEALKEGLPNVIEKARAKVSP